MPSKRQHDEVSDDSDYNSDSDVREDENTNKAVDLVSADDPRLENTIPDWF